MSGFEFSAVLCQVLFFSLVLDQSSKYYTEYKANSCGQHLYSQTGIESSLAHSSTNMRITLLAASFAFLSSAGVNGHSLPRTYNYTASTTIHTDIVHQFPNGTWLENMAVRRSGQILVNVLNTPDIYQIDPLHANNAPVLIHHIPGVTGLLGIAEIQEDVFYVLAGNFSIATFKSTHGSYSLWKVDLRTSRAQIDGPAYSPAIVSKVVDITEAFFLNGLALLNKAKGLIVAADSEAGLVYTLNVETGVYVKTIDDPTMKPDESSVLPGINGLKVQDGYLYYSATGPQTFNRIPINSADGTAAGPAEVIAKNIVVDDFSLDTKGNAYVARLTDNAVARISTNGVVTQLAGNLNSTLVPGPTCTGFGRTKRDRSVLYVTTSGGAADPVNGTIIEGGKLVAVYL